MNIQALSARVRTKGGVAVVELAGDVDGSAESALKAGYKEAVATGAATILLDFGDVGYINSTGIALIVGVLAEARRDKRKVVACGLSGHYREIFQVTRLSDFMPIFADEHEALTGAGA
jgi:anti-anti-sigma factor